MRAGIHYRNGFAQNYDPEQKESLVLTAEPGVYVKCYCVAGLKMIPLSRREIAS